MSCFRKQYWSYWRNAQYNGQIPPWWRWYIHASPIAWTINGLVTSQLGDIDELIEIPGSTLKPTVKQFLKSAPWLKLPLSFYSSWPLLMVSSS
ncbi:hypothetical protein Syun_030184 [Stephania yunnanensis]|uniref:Uncharacterized protein n=1 Tax=Stephania yunnanensis TaxID=152371 RepID=A0AAP0E6V1_9MAGN